MRHGSGSILAPPALWAAPCATADLGRRWAVEDGLEGALGTDQVRGPGQLAHHQALGPQRQVLAGQPFAFARIVIGKDRRSQSARSIDPDNLALSGSCDKRIEVDQPVNLGTAAVPSEPVAVEPDCPTRRNQLGRAKSLLQLEPDL